MQKQYAHTHKKNSQLFQVLVQPSLEPSSSDISTTFSLQTRRTRVAELEGEREYKEVLVVEKEGKEGEEGEGRHSKEERKLQ